MKVHHSLATYHGGPTDMNKRCAMWLPTFLQRGIHFFGERTEVLAFDNFVLFDRVHLSIIGRRAGRGRGGVLFVREVRPRDRGLSRALLHYFRLQYAYKPIGEFSTHIIRSSGGPTLNGSTQYPARFFCAEYETFNFVFHSDYLVGISTPMRCAPTSSRC